MSTKKTKRTRNAYGQNEQPAAATGTALAPGRQTGAHREAARRADRLAATVGTARHYDRLFVFRESDENAYGELEKLIEYTCRPYEDDADVAEFLTHGVALAEKGRAAEELRARYNARTLTGGLSGRKTIGWVFEIGETLFLVSLFSAAKSNENESNDFTDRLAELVLRHSVSEIVTGPITRVARSKRHGMKLADACEKARTTIVAYGCPPMAMWTDAGSQSFSNYLDGAVWDYTNTVDRLQRGAHDVLMDGQWAKSEDSLPALGCYRFETVYGPRGQQSIRVVPDVTKQDLVRDVLTWGASDLTEHEIAEKLATKYGWGSAVLRARLNNPTATVLDARNPHLVVRSMLNRLVGNQRIDESGDIVIGSLLETGVYYYEQRIPIADEKVAAAVTEKWRAVGRVKFLATELDFGHDALPGGKWVPDELVAACREKRFGGQREESAKGRAASRHVERKPLTGFPAWLVDDHEWRLGAFSGRSYQLVRRPLTVARDAAGRSLGWRFEECEKMATIDDVELHGAVAGAIVAALTENGVQWQRETTRKGAPRARETSLLENELAMAEKAANRARNLYGIADEIFGEDPTAANRETLKSATRDLSNAEQRVRELRREITDAELAVDVPGLTDAARAQVSDLFAAVALLAQTDGKAPAILNLALRDRVLDFRFVVTDDRAHVAVSLYLSVDTDEGPAVFGPVECRVRNVATADRVRARREGVLERRFALGESLDEIRDALGFTTREKVARAIHDEFRRLGILPSIGLRVAAIDCPIAETRRVIWAMVEEAKNGKPFRVPAGIDPAFASHVRDVYSSNAGWVFAWVLDTQETVRRAIASAKASGDDGIGWDVFVRDVLPQITTLSPRVVGEELTRGKRRRGAGASSLAPVFDRSEKWHNKNPDRRVWVRPCPFCGTRTLDHPVRVPEVPGGLICSTCRRAPELPTVVFPADYGRKWSGPRNTIAEKGESGAGGTVEVL
jgi:hypothetical protein